MHDWLDIARPLAAGLLLGAFFFAGLWWTMVKGIASRRPALWFSVSMLVRTSVALVGFYLSGRESWQRWLWCLCGFLLARLIVLLHRPREAMYAP